MNRDMLVSNTPNETFGAQQSLSARLCVRVQHLMEHSEETALFRCNKELHVKLSGDGTWIGKRIHCVVFSFTLLEERSTVASVEGVHPLAVFREAEAYSCLQQALSDIIQEVEDITKEGITINGVLYKVRTFVLIRMLWESES
jgi:hypothetical protein